MGVALRVSSNALATAANNALAFLPAASTIKVARLRVTGDRIEFTATDTYAAGRATCTAEDVMGDPGALVLLSREALQGLDKAGRMDKKNQGTLKVNPGDGIVFTPGDGEVPPVAHMDLLSANRHLLETFSAVDEMIADRLPEDSCTAFQPQLLQYFAKVKADKSERVADLCIADPEAPVLVKIGTDFNGLIMPVYRDKHADLVGEEGLW